MDWGIYILLFLMGFGAFIVSTLTGGGGAMLMVPLVNFFVSKEAVAPLVHLGNFIGRPSRIIIFWKHIRKDIVKAYTPMAIVGAFLGAWLFSSMRLEWLQIFLGIFLVSTLWQYRWGKRESSFPMKLSYFGPLGFGVSFLSSLIGATGAVLNPFYLNFGVTKEQLVATKAANSFLVAIVQIATYSKFGMLDGELWIYGLAIGLGATAGNFVGKRWLSRMPNQVFRFLVIGMMVISGVVILIQQYFALTS
mgnify:CR=1 FL=1|jgi:uncharacterized protein